MEAVSSQQLPVKYNKVHVITACRDKYIIKTNLQENISIFNQINPIQAIGNKLVSLTTKPPTPDQISNRIVWINILKLWEDGKVY